MPKPLLNAALGVALALCSPPALAGEGNAGTLGFIAGGGRGGGAGAGIVALPPQDLGGDPVEGEQGGGGAKDESNYYYIYLGAYYETPKVAGPLSWRFGALALDYSGMWFQSFQSGQGVKARMLRLMAGPSLNVDLPGEWWLWEGPQVGMDLENAGPGHPLLVLQNELMFGRGFFSSYWKFDLRVKPDGGLEMRYLAGQIFFRLARWLSLGPELRYQTSEPSVGLLAQVGDDRPRQRWNVTAGCTFDEKLGGQWHLDLWFAL